jgi:hypothetical protein
MCRLVFLFNGSSHFHFLYGATQNPLLFAAVQLQSENHPVMNIPNSAAANAHGSMQIQARSDDI